MTKNGLTAVLFFRFAQSKPCDSKTGKDGKSMKGGL